MRADLDDDAWPGLGSPDLVWASASMHHMARPGRALRTVHAALAPGGLFAVVELAGHPRFLPENAPEDLTALDRLLDTGGPHSVLRRDDLTVRTERTVWAARRT
ncbi:hypothetical protein GCM10010294_39020 [Streptomyces griseoloalbus]|nr:hypothetical protein GCM10010294_39020 [Streptomyces griseoloalbus]